MYRTNETVRPLALPMSQLHTYWKIWGSHPLWLTMANLAASQHSSHHHGLPSLTLYLHSVLYKCRKWTQCSCNQVTYSLYCDRQRPSKLQRQQIWHLPESNITSKNDMNFVLFAEMKSDIISVTHKSHTLTTSHILPFTILCLLNITQLDLRQIIHHKILPMGLNHKTSVHMEGSENKMKALPFLSAVGTIRKSLTSPSVNLWFWNI